VVDLLDLIKGVYLVVFSFASLSQIFGLINYCEFVVSSVV